MLAIAVLFFFGVYLLITLWVVLTTIAWAKRNNRSPLKWGGLAAFVMYNLVFWDWLPTVVAHQYYCATEAGFTVYKTPDQWMEENPDLTTKDLKPLGKNKEMLWDFPYKRLKNNPQKNVLMINQRIYLTTDNEKNILSFFPIHKSIGFVADNRDDQRLAQHITFERGYGNMMTHPNWRVMKFWLAKSNCSGLTDGDEELVSGYKNFIKQIIELGEYK